MNRLKFNHNSKSSAKSNRQLKVAESVKRCLSNVLNNDKVMTFALGDQSFTISKVDMSPDLTRSSWANCTECNTSNQVTGYIAWETSSTCYCIIGSGWSYLSLTQVTHW